MNVDSIWPINSSAFNITSLGDRLQFNCSSASWLLNTCTSRFSLVKTVFVPVVCVVGIIGNLLTLFVLSRRRLSVVSDNSVRAVHSCMKALAVSDLILCASLLPHGFLLHDCIVHVRRSFHLVYWLYSGAVINTFILTSTWLTVTFTCITLADGHDGCRTLPGRVLSVPCQAADRPALYPLDHHSHLRCQLPRQRSAFLRKRCPVHPCLRRSSFIVTGGHMTVFSQLTVTKRRRV